MNNKRNEDRPGLSGWGNKWRQAVLAAGLMLAGSTAWAQAGVYQMYYVPVPEDEATTFNKAITSNANNTGNSVLSISVVLDDTLIYFDHSEDGYEDFITHPAQGTTSVWGDGDCSNGFRPDSPSCNSADDESWC